MIHNNVLAHQITVARQFTEYPCAQVQVHNTGYNGCMTFGSCRATWPSSLLSSHSDSGT